MHNKVTIYVKESCPFCIQAIKLFEDKQIEFEKISVDGDPEAAEKIKSETGHPTFPQILIENKFIGGCQEITAFEATGELDRLLHTK